MKLSIASAALLLSVFTIGTPTVWARVGDGNRNLKKTDTSMDTDEDDRDMDMDGVVINSAFQGTVTEVQPCEPNVERAKTFIASYGQYQLGSMECFNDPVNGCPGGCCRMGGPYFICDEDGDLSPGLPCVCNSNTAPPPEPEPVVAATPAPRSDIVDTAISAGSFETLVNLVATANLVDVLKSPGPFTVFAPNDSAFPTGAALEEFLSSTSMEALTSILTYHVVPGRILSTDLVNGAKVGTVQGSNITVNLMNGVKINDANVVAADILASNGVIHVIDSILMPPAKPVVAATPASDIVDTAISAGSFETLVDLVATANLVDVLKSPGPFTVFAPNDSAFPTGAALEAFKNSTSMEALSSILTYHVVPGRILSTDLVNGAKVSTIEGSNITVNLMNGVKINNANVVAADILASNGVIHVIDSILMPPAKPVVAATPAPGLASGSDIVDTAISAGSFETLVNLVATANLVDVLKSPGPFTVFAPNDSAFPTGAALEEFLSSTSMETLASILTYHVVPGRILSTDLVSGARVTTVQGGNLIVNLSSGVKINDANVVAADILASNGVIHVIDSMLLPPPSSMPGVSVSKFSVQKEGPF